MKKHIIKAAAAGALLMASGVAVQAQDAPGYFASTFGIPSAVQAPNGYASVGISYVTPRDGVQGDGGDGDVSLAYAFGNPITGIGFTAGATISGLDPFGDSGAFSLSASRFVGVTQNTATFIGASVNNIAPWGDTKSDDTKSALYVTTVGDLNMGSRAVPFEATIGYGQETYTNSSGVLKDSVFWGFGLGVAPGVSASLSGADDIVNIGATFAVPGLEGLAISAGVTDVANTTNRQQTMITIGYGIKLGGGS